MKEKFELSIPQVNLAADVLADIFTDRLGCHSDELHTAAGALRAAAMVCELASTLHEKEGREVLLKTAYQKLYLSPAKQDAVGSGGTQELVAKMFCPVNVGVVDPIANRRDPWEPKLVASCEIDVVAGKARAALNRLNSLDPARHIDNTVQPECCTGCVNSYASCAHSPEEDGECVGRETVSVPAGKPEENAPTEYLRAKWPVCTLCSQVPAECRHDPLANGTCAGYMPCNLTQAAAAQDTSPVSS